MFKTNLSLGFLLTAGLIYGCSSDEKSSGNNSGGNGGDTSTGGSTAGGGSSAVAGGGTGGDAAGASGAAGSSGAAGAANGFAPNEDGTCPRRSTKHADDMLCYCQPSTLSHCSDACANFQTDPDHCGDCDTVCGASEPCFQGQCGSTPVEAVPAAAGCGSIHLAVAGGVLYWTDTMHGTVKSMPTAGGATATVADTQNAPTLLQIHGDSIYWLNSGDNTIMKAPVAGGAAVAVVSAPDAGADVIVGGFTVSADGNTLYFSIGRTVSSTSTTPGGTITEIGHEDEGFPKALAVADDIVAYPADQTGDIDVMTRTEGTPAVCASEDSTTATNLNCKRVARSQSNFNLETVELIGGNVYWASQSSVQTSSATAPTGLNDVVATGSSDAQQIRAFTISNSTVYLADDKGVVFKAPLMVDATEIPLARAQVGITSIAADDTYVYWATGDCAIMSLPTN